MNLTQMEITRVVTTVPNLVKGKKEEDEIEFAWFLDGKF